MNVRSNHQKRHSVRREIKKIGGGVLDIFYPRRCPICHEILRPSEGLAHSACKAKLHYVHEPVCLKCGKPVISGDEVYCRDCERRRHVYDRGRAVWVYDTWMRKSIAMYKYHNAKSYADFYVEQMVALLGDWLQSIRPDAVIPVPVHRRKKNQRGYNQAELLARGLGRRLGRPVVTDYLLRTSWTKPQKSLTAAERYANLKKAFRVTANRRAYKTVLLVDDIYTTGSTIDACAAVLKNAGVQKVYFVSLCIGSDDGG